MESNLDFIPDLPKGPLDEYRNISPSVNWKRLKVYLEGEEAVRVKYRTIQIMEESPIFSRALNPNTDEQKRIAGVQMMKIKDLNMFPPEIYSMKFRPRVITPPNSERWTRNLTTVLNAKHNSQSNELKMLKWIVGEHIIKRKNNSYQI